VTSWPRSISSYAQQSPPMPAPATITRFAVLRACGTDASDSGAASAAATPAAARRTTSRRLGIKGIRSGVRGELLTLIVWPPVTIVSDVPVVSTGHRPGSAPLRPAGLPPTIRRTAEPARLARPVLSQRVHPPDTPSRTAEMD